MTDFGEQFIQSGGEAIEYDGKLVHMSHVMGPLPSGVLKLRLHARGVLEQGVGISADGGWLTINGEKSKKFGLWTSTAPQPVEVATKPLRGRDSMTVRIWNVWKHPRWGSTMAWVSSAGLLVESATTTSVRLHASAGPGGPAFDDLVIEAAFEGD